MKKVSSAAIGLLAAAAMSTGFVRPAAAQLCASTYFGNEVAVPMSSNPIAAATADFNGDGRADLVSTQAGSEELSIRLATGPMTYGPMQTITGAGGDPLVVADVDRDGKPDILAGSWDSRGGFYFHRGNGDGTFAAPVFVQIGWRPQNLTVADMDRDGIPDVVASGVVDNASWRVVLLFGNGDGTFRAGSTRTDTWWYGVSATFVGDMDGDGLPDVAVSSPNGLAIFRQDGQGGLLGPLFPYFGPNPVALGMVEVPGFGRSQLLYRLDSGDLWLMNVEGTGMGAYPLSISAPGASRAVRGDFDGDGILDVALPSYGSLVVLRGTGTSNPPFERMLTQDLSIGPMDGVAADADGNGALDLVLPVYGSGAVYVLPNARGQANGLGISAPATMCGNDTRHASAPDINVFATSYAWSVSGGWLLSDPSSRSVDFSGPEPGATEVVLNVTMQAPGCPPVEGTRHVAVEQWGEMTAPDYACAGAVVTASVPDAGPGGTYDWSVYSWSTILSGQGTREITLTMPTDGYQATSVFCNVRNSTSWCSHSYSKNVTVRPWAGFPNPTTVCLGSTSSAAVDDQGPDAVYTWAIDYGTIVSGQGTRSITFSSTHVPFATLSLAVQVGECVASRSVLVSVFDPAVAITAHAAVCPGSTGNVASVTDAGPYAWYDWTVNGGWITSGLATRSITFRAGPIGPMSLRCTVTRDLVQTTCSSSATQMVAVIAPSIAIAAPSRACAGTAGLVASVDAGVGATYAWTITNGTITAGGSAPSVTFTAGSAGTTALSVTVTHPEGCTSTGTASVTVDARPSVAITASASVCANAADLSASVPDAWAGATYNWSISGGTITAGAGTRAITWTAGAGGAATISVAVVTGAGCSSSGITNVALSAVPSASIAAASSVRKNSKNNVASAPDAGAGATYNWSITNGFITSGAGTPSIRYTAGGRGTLSLAVTVRSGAGCSASGTRDVAVTN